MRRIVLHNTCGAICGSIGGGICWRMFRLWCARNLSLNMRWCTWRKTRRITGRTLWSRLCAALDSPLPRLHALRTGCHSCYSANRRTDQAGFRSAPLLLKLIAQPLNNIAVLASQGVRVNVEGTGLERVQYCIWYSYIHMRNTCFTTLGKLYFWSIE